MALIVVGQAFSTVSGMCADACNREMSIVQPCPVRNHLRPLWNHPCVVRKHLCPVLNWLREPWTFTWRVLHTQLLLVAAPDKSVQLSLFTADFVQALGVVLEIRWIDAGKVRIGSFCTAQGQALPPVWCARFVDESQGYFSISVKRQWQ
jgi:hypothetical protein